MRINDIGKNSCGVCDVRIAYIFTLSFSKTRFAFIFCVWSSDYAIIILIKQYSIWLLFSLQSIFRMMGILGCVIASEDPGSAIKTRQYLITILALNILSTNSTIRASGVNILEMKPCILCKQKFISHPDGPIKEFTMASCGCLFHHKK